MVKGAPEKLKEISHDGAQNFKGYNETVMKLSLAGLRSLAFGIKRVAPNYQQLANLDRNEFEQGV